MNAKRVTDKQPTIPEMVNDVANLEAMHQASAVEVTVDLYAAAVTVAERLAKALADIMPRKLPNGSYGNGKYANAADLLDRLDPGWREREGE